MSEGQILIGGGGSLCMPGQLTAGAAEGRARVPRPPADLSRIAVLLACVIAAVVYPSAAWSRHLARLDPTEPLFTQRAFVEKNLELDTTWDKLPSENDVELAPGVSWVFWQRLELDAELPVAVRIPDHAATVGSIGDLGFGAQLLLYSDPQGLLDYFSVRGDIAPPTGDRAKEIGGNGSWSVSLLPARRFTVVQSLPDLMVQMQLAYGEDLRATPSPSGDDRVREKAAFWNTAFAQQYWAGRVRPVFEVLGTTVVDAVESKDERTVVELAAGMWIAPFPDDNFLSPLSIGLGWKWPVSGRLDSELTGLLITEWSFGT